MYLKVHAEAKADFERFLRQGSLYINRHMLSVMSLLGPLRRCCSGGALRPMVGLVTDRVHITGVADSLAMQQALLEWVEYLA